jgi:muramoyltetrapeptide carboxypeptidase
MDTLKPQRLQRGDLIGLVSPASRIADTTKIDQAVRYLEGLGYRAVIGANATKINTYLAGTDEERAADLNAMFENPRVKAIFCIRGGYGTPRLLPLIRYRMVARNPKILVGYSDITALQLAIWRKTGLVTFHGPMAGVDMADPMDSFTEELFWRLLTSTKRMGRVVIPDEQPHTLVPGRGTGRLLGGNLALIASIVGTNYQPDFSKAILYIEDIGEDPYRVDRMLTQLRGSGILPKAHAVLLGQFTDCVPRDSSSPSFTVDEVLQEYTYRSGVPSLSGLPFGHNRRKMTIPVGIRARVNATQRSVEYLEGAVR